MGEAKAQRAQGQQTRPLRVAIAGGGTGGHVYPALAIGAALAKRGHEVVYFGDPDRLEGRVVPERGLWFQPVPSVQYPRHGVASKVRFLFGLLGSVLRSRRLLRQVGARVVLGVGGYISAPPVLAAWTLRIPRAIHESNVAPGLANRLCARFANLVMLAYEQTACRLPGSAPREVVGCPVDPSVLQGERAAARTRYGLAIDAPVLLVVGGSLGAEALNRLAVAAARRSDRDWQILHVTGPRYLEPVKAELDPLPKGVVLVGYEDRMADAYAAADLVICRAGSSTLAELMALGKPSILVPSPNVTDNHQEANARGLETTGAALVLTERDLDVDRAIDRIGALLADPVALSHMSEAARTQARLDTADRVADLLERLVPDDR